MTRVLTWVDGVQVVRDMTPQELAEYEQPQEPNRAAMNLTFDQMLIGFVTEGWITKAEGEGWLNGVLPAPVTTRIAMLPADLQFKATARAKRQTVIRRDDELIVALGGLRSKTPAQIDAFFMTYAAI